MREGYATLNRLDCGLRSARFTVSKMPYKMRCIVAVLITLFIICSIAWQNDRVRLRDVQVITLRQGEYTTGRRSLPVPQLKCLGGSAGCRDAPSTVQCQNRGSDGRDVQWECKAEMTKFQKFGQCQVTCEGYDYPQDDFILVGSCGLEYYLEKVNKDIGPPTSPHGNPDVGAGVGLVYLIIAIWTLIAYVGGYI